jgi:hypothetical protein
MSTGVNSLRTVCKTHFIDTAVYKPRARHQQREDASFSLSRGQPFSPSLPRYHKKVDGKQ